MTVSSIVQRLLEENHITAEEAIIFLKAELGKQCCSVTTPIMPVAPYSPPSPYNPPLHPLRVGDTLPNQPQIWYSSGTGKPGPSCTLNDNFTGK